MEDKLNNARTKNKALEKIIGKMDAEIYELKTDLQSMVDRLKVRVSAEFYSVSATGTLRSSFLTKEKHWNQHRQ